MTPIEKAKELVDRFKFYQLPEDKRILIDNPKQCALICVEELIKLYEFENPNRGFKISYWDEVYQELKN